MSCILLLTAGGASRVVEYWTATRGACVEMADLWRFGGYAVWMEVVR